MNLSNLVAMPRTAAMPLPSNGNLPRPPRRSLREQMADIYAAEAIEALVRRSRDLPDLIARLDRALAVR